MTLDLRAIEDGLASAFAQVTGIEPASVVWKNRARPMTPTNGQLVTLAWRRIVDVSTDEKLYRTTSTDPAPALNLTPGQVTLRLMVLALTFESMDQRPEWNAWQMAESLRSNVYGDTCLALLAAIGLSTASMSESVDADYATKNGRWSSRCSCVIRLNQSDYTDDTQSTTNTIDHVIVASDLSDAGGVLLPAPPNYTNDEIPPP